QTRWENMRDVRLSGVQDRWGGFGCQDQWELARWMMKSVLSQGEIDKYLKLNIVSSYSYTKTRTKPACHNKQEFFKLIDALPTSHIPESECEVIEVQGTRLDAHGRPQVEELELWRRNPIECICEIIGNPALEDHIKYAPIKIFTNETCDEQIFNEM
ncbi:hypothetical protein M422DRAFT_87064, partial [Sphaerobolus stellatus SS14]